jgi:hypothetical protein
MAKILKLYHTFTQLYMEGEYIVLIHSFFYKIQVSRTKFGHNTNTLLMTRGYGKTYMKEVRSLSVGCFDSLLHIKLIINSSLNSSVPLFSLKLPS